MDNLEANRRDGLQTAVDGIETNNYLGDPQVINHLVREFLGAVFTERAKFHQDGDGDASSARIAAMCARNAQIVMGENSSYAAQPWNSPHRLGIYLRVTTPDVADYATPAEAYFNFLALQALEASINLEEGAMTEEEVQAGLTEVVDDAVDVLLGRKPGAQR
jgi:hypothetical protein